MRRTLIAVSSLALVATGAFTLPSISQAVSGTGVYGTWTASAGSGDLVFTGTLYPSALTSSSTSTQSVARSQTLTSNTPFGAVYGTSSNQTYLLTAIASGQPKGSITLDFSFALTPGTWGFALGDVDAEDVTITATNAAGRAIDTSGWWMSSFNYASGADEPTWNSSTSSLVGSGSDTQGASAWFRPTSAVDKITLTQTRRSGFPQYQLWVAADKPAPAASASAAATSASPTASASASGSASASATASASESPSVSVSPSASASASATASASAICTSTDTALVNGGFEQPSIPTKSYRQIVDTDVPGWNTTATDKKIEIWSDGYGGVSAPSGRQFAELNATQDSELYQEVATVPGQKLVWSLYHRARGAGAIGDTMYVNIGAPNAAPNSTTTLNDALTEGWVLHTGTYVVPAGQTSTRFGFESGPTASKNKSIGNFLDNIFFTTESCITPEATTPPVNPPTVTATPTPTVTPKPTETITPDLPEPIPAPIGDTITITPEDLPGVPEDAVIIDVKKPEHGDAVVDNGQVLYTPERGYDGPVELIVIVKERDGSVTQVDIPLETGKSQYAVNLKLPEELFRGSNVINVNNLRTNAKQRAKVTVTCVPVNRTKPIGGIAACEVVRMGGKVFVDSRSASRVTVSLSAPAKGKFLPYREVVTYRIR